MRKLDDIFSQRDFYHVLERSGLISPMSPEDIVEAWNGSPWSSETEKVYRLPNNAIWRRMVSNSFLGKMARDEWAHNLAAILVFHSSKLTAIQIISTITRLQSLAEGDLHLRKLISKYVSVPMKQQNVNSGTREWQSWVEIESIPGFLKVSAMSEEDINNQVKEWLTENYFKSNETDEFVQSRVDDFYDNNFKHSANPSAESFVAWYNNPQNWATQGSTDEKLTFGKVAKSFKKNKNLMWLKHGPEYYIAMGMITDGWFHPSYEFEKREKKKIRAVVGDGDYRYVMTRYVIYLISLNSKTDCTIFNQLSSRRQADWMNRTYDNAGRNRVEAPYDAEKFDHMIEQRVIRAHAEAMCRIALEVLPNRVQPQDSTYENDKIDSWVIGWVARNTVRTVVWPSREDADTPKVSDGAIVRVLEWMRGERKEIPLRALRQRHVPVKYRVKSGFISGWAGTAVLTSAESGSRAVAAARLASVNLVEITSSGDDVAAAMSTWNAALRWVATMGLLGYPYNASKFWMGRPTEFLRTIYISQEPWRYAGGYVNRAIGTLLYRNPLTVDDTEDSFNDMITRYATCMGRGAPKESCLTWLEEEVASVVAIKTKSQRSIKVARELLSTPRALGGLGHAYYDGTGRLAIVSRVNYPKVENKVLTQRSLEQTRLLVGKNKAAERMASIFTAQVLERQPRVDWDLVKRDEVTETESVARTTQRQSPVWRHSAPRSLILIDLPAVIRHMGDRFADFFENPTEVVRLMRMSRAAFITLLTGGEDKITPTGYLTHPTIAKVWLEQYMDELYGSAQRRAAHTKGELRTIELSVERRMREAIVSYDRISIHA
jgi:hypothetical protein